MLPVIARSCRPNLVLQASRAFAVTGDALPPGTRNAPDPAQQDTQAHARPLELPSDAQDAMHQAVPAPEGSTAAAAASTDNTQAVPAQASDEPQQPQRRRPRLTVNAPMPRFIAPTIKLFKDQMNLETALDVVKANAKAKFDESVEIALNLGVDPRRGDQTVRGTVVLPHGTGKSVKVAVFAEGEDADAARAAGADVVGGPELVQQISSSGGGSISFGKCVAVPAMMPQLGRVARILGPKGLMPSPKLGTVTNDVAEAVRLLKSGGKVEFRADRGAVLHAGIGKVSYERQQLQDNIAALCDALLRIRPKRVKGTGVTGYFIRAAVSSTMGPGVPVSIASLAAATQQARVRS